MSICAPSVIHSFTKSCGPFPCKVSIASFTSNALGKLAEFVKAQGGDAAAVYDTSLLPKASIVEEILSEEEGYLEKLVCDEVGICALLLGGGRETKESEIDLSVGLLSGQFP